MEQSNLEYAVKSERKPRYRSEGERRVAYFLEENQIRYQYEPGVLVKSPEGQPRIWYPDFYLPEFGAYIEYYGLAGRGSYDSGIRRKKQVYKTMEYEVIDLYPWSFAEDWRGYVMSELRSVVERRYQRLLGKPYWQQGAGQSAVRPYGRSTGYGSRRGHY